MAADAAPRHATTVEEIGALLDVSCDAQVYESQIEGSIRALLARRIVLIERCAAPSAGAAEECSSEDVGVDEGGSVGRVKEGDAGAGGGGSAAVADDVGAGDLFEDWDAGLYGANTVYPLESRLDERDAL